MKALFAGRYLLAQKAIAVLAPQEFRGRVSEGSNLCLLGAAPREAKAGSFAYASVVDADLWLH